MIDEQVKHILREYIDGRVINKPYDVFIVWSCKTLQNRNWLLGTTLDDHYYELTYNGDKDEMYIDDYVKVNNLLINNPFESQTSNRRVYSSLWHDGMDKPTEEGWYLAYLHYEYEDFPEDNYSEWATIYWQNGSWTDEHFNDEADYTIERWCRVNDLLTDKTNNNLIQHDEIQLT